MSTDLKTLTRAERQRQWYAKNREVQRAKNRERYHARYKNSPEFKAKQARNWANYSKSKGPQWVRARSKKYKKPLNYSGLTEAQKQARRDAYKVWAKQNWSSRVEYARNYRRKVNPTVGLKSLIKATRETGDVRTLTAFCLSSLISLDAKNSGPTADD